MSKGHLSQDNFFQRLAELFETSKHGSIYLTQKRMAYGSEPSSDPSDPSEQFPDLDLSKPLPIIIRATNGKSKANREKKIKLSTVVEADALEGFFFKYAEVCKGGMSALKKRDRSKAKEKLKAKKKKLGGATGIVAAEGKKS
ncbi:Uncharacterized protein BP5553_08909 [Venustampulla echinocandica]|uniref:Signal recognition particle subunit SRP14 n=1 Tax=Venustampulla echinocandica TaxID=2656787 RepID=A0A370TDA6_9HELO|nr:Uncharacterized protein BP5553_08909 [Venustampulla echinocandica]RDL32453.1 Uncharacterized protein BP5553_08909 [Venustampulla echinocandica]